VKITRELPDLAATERLARELSTVLAPPMTLALNGELGAGKTQFVRCFAAACGVPSEEVTSPTYVLIQRYKGDSVIYHFDFYRLETEGQVWDLGIDEIYESHSLVLIEWANKFPQCLPEDYVELTLSRTSGETLEGSSTASQEPRFAIFRAHGPRSGKCLTNLSVQQSN
jgi:tRNA threonylcarbamoyladenosine biosynthesis protein TsaE